MSNATLHPVPEDIATALADGDRRRALELLMAQYGDAILRFAVEMTRDRALADEIRQQVFVEAYRDLERFAQRSSIRTWLFGIARHRCLDATKLRRRWFHRYKNDAPPEAQTHVADLDATLDRERLARFLEECVGKLAPAAREAVLLRHQQELSYDEASEITGERAGTLQQRVARALPVLRRCLESRLGAPLGGPR